MNARRLSACAFPPRTRPGLVLAGLAILLAPCPAGRAGDAGGFTNRAAPPAVIASARIQAANFTVQHPRLRFEQAMRQSPPRWQQAAETLHQLLTEQHSARFTANDGSFPSVRDWAERAMLDSPPDLLREYHLLVDAQVAADLGPNIRKTDAAVLRQVADRALLAARGPEAATELAHRLLDADRPLPARRLFARVLDRGRPDARARSTLLRGLAACQARQDDPRATGETLRLLEAASGDSARKLADRIVRPAASSALAPSAPHPGGRSPAPPAFLQAATSTRLTREWTHPFASHLVTANRPKDGLRERAAEMHWRDCLDVPVRGPILNQGRLLFAGPAALVSIRPDTGGAAWTEPDKTQPSTTATRPQPNTLDSLFVPCADRIGERRFFSRDVPDTLHPPQGHAAFLGFHDWANAAVSIHEGRFYHIENWMRNQGSGGRLARETVRFTQGNGQDGEPLPFCNRLVARDAKTGKRLWKLDAIRPPERGIAEIPRTRFLNAPAAQGDRLFVHFEDVRQWWAAALHLDTRETIWCAPLGFHVAPDEATWHPGMVLPAGEDVYVLTGQGLVYALNAETGAIEWVIPYDRSLRGWQANTLYAAGSRLVALPADADRILVLDRTDGRLVRAIPLDGWRWPLGWDARRLWVASRDAVGCLDTETGATLWRHAMPADRRIFGRGFVTDREVVTPAGRSIVRLAADTGEPLGDTPVAVPEDQPAGNLATDGQALYMTGLGYVARLGPAAATLARLEADRSPAARLELAALREAWGELGAAAKAYAGALAAAPDEATRERASEALLACLERPDAAADAAGAHLPFVSAPPPTDLAPARGLAGESVEANAERGEAAPPSSQIRLLTVLREAEPRMAAKYGPRLLRLRARFAAAAGAWDASVDAWLALSRGAEPIALPEPGGTLLTMPECYAAAGLRELLLGAADRVAPLLAARAAAARAELRTAHAPASLEALRRLYRLYPGTKEGIEAGLAAARTALDRGEIERADLMLQDLAASPIPATAAAGKAALDKLTWPCAAAGNPPLYSESARLPLAPPPWRHVWSTTNSTNETFTMLKQTFVSHDRNADSTFLESHCFYLLKNKRQPPAATPAAAGSTLTCRRLSDGRIRYTTALESFQTLREGFGNSPLTAHILMLRRSSGRSDRPDEVAACGLLSGRVLWRKNIQRRSHVGTIRRRLRITDRPQRTPAILVDGITDGSIRFLDPATGDFLWDWRPDCWFPSEILQNVEYAVLLSPSGTELAVHDVLSGLPLRTRAETNHAIRPQTTLLTPFGLLAENAVTAACERPFTVLLRLPGLETAWIRECETTRVVESLRHLVGHAVLRGDPTTATSLLDLSDGRLIWKAPQPQGSPLEPIRWDAKANRLFLVGPTGGEDEREHVFSVLNPASGHVEFAFRSLWVRPQSVFRAVFHKHMVRTETDLFHRVGRYLPWAVPTAPAFRPRNVGMGTSLFRCEPSRMAILDLHTGTFDDKLAGQCLGFPPDLQIRELHSQAGLLFVIGLDQIHVFGPLK